MPQPRIRVVVVDDAVVVRRLITDVLGEDPGIEVVGTAANGRLGLELIAKLEPDIVTLDTDMPEMDGLAVLRELRRSGRELPVIMFSAATERSANVTIEALSLGASDYLTKPTTGGGVTASIQRVRDELIPRIRQLVHTRKPASTTAAPDRAPAAAATPLRRERIEVVAIGVSTGGPNALAELLPNIARDLPVPILIVQHMPPMFTRFLAERLSAQSGFSVHEAGDNDRLRPGDVYVAPGDYHLTVRRSGAQVVTALSQGPPEQSCRPAVDVLLRSVNEVYGRHALVTILTGMGQDGLAGCRVLKQRGAQVLVQDEDSSVVWGMPGAVAREGLADRVLPLSQIAAEINRRVRAGARLPHADPVSASL